VHDALFNDVRLYLRMNDHVLHFNLRSKVPHPRLSFLPHIECRGAVCVVQISCASVAKDSRLLMLECCSMVFVIPWKFTSLLAPPRLPEVPFHFCGLLLVGGACRESFFSQDSSYHVNTQDQQASTRQHPSDSFRQAISLSSNLLQFLLTKFLQTRFP
jgi:hypothetical protein